MVLKEFEITLDLIKSKQLNSIEVVQGDFETNIFNIQLTKDYSPVNLSGTTIEVLFAKPDNTTVMQDMDTGVSIVDAAQGKIKVVLNTNTIAAPGMVYAEVRIKEAGKIATTAKFNFYVRKAIVSNVKSTNEFPVLEQLINDVEQLKDDIINLQIPDGSIKDIKLSNEAGQIKERVSIIQQKVDDLEEEMNAPDYSAPQEATESIITLPSTVVEGQFSDIVLLGRSLKQELNYNRDTWTEWTNPQFTTIENQSMVFAGSSVYKHRQLQIPTFQSGDKFGVLFFIPKNTTVNGSRGVILTSETGTSQVSNTINVGTSAGWIKGILTATVVGKYFRIFIDGLVTSGEIAFKDVQLYRLPAGSEIESDFETMTADELAQKYPYIQGGGVVSTESVRVRATNGTLDLTKIENFNIAYMTVSYDGEYIVVPQVASSTGYMLSKNKMPVTPGDTHVLQMESSNATMPRFLIRFTDVQGNVISSSISNWQYISAYRGYIYAGEEATIIVPQNAVYMQCGVTSRGEGSYKFKNYIVDKPFQSGGEAYINWEGRSLPNGTKDEASVTKGEKTQRVGKATIDGSLNWGSSKTRDNTYRCAVTLWGTNNNAANYSNNNIFAISSTGTIYRATEYEENDFEFVTILYGSLYVSIEKSKIDAMSGSDMITKFKNYLNQYPITLIYQLATPIVTKEPAQSLIAYPGGHLIIEPVVRVTKPYKGGISVDKPIQAIESITKVEDGVRTPVDVSKATVASDKLSLTITGASNNEIYEIIYQYPPELTTLPTIRYSYSMNTAAAIAENTKGVAANSKAINDFIAYQNAVNLQFDLRITALEP